jgi:hypothetical protein
MPAIQTTPASPATRTTGAHPLWTLVTDMVAPIAIYYGARAAGASIWLALVASAVVPAASALAGILARRRVDAMGFLVLAALAASAVFSLLTGSLRSGFWRILRDGADS